ncbi:methyltransferase domain-containing protein [Aliikangiella sp. G2MR2-5]|uniref:methyltransferase domain-containing protein n=1 Tax=Aliikangiella sp. G2MR2-5 TaxID=2788943 RepID=UPI0018AAFC29|nr:methyltransferase domain-containing protein [Aliikangiella sp. G2MR2-5]
MASNSPASSILESFLHHIDCPIVDTRSEGAFTQGHLKDSCNIPLNELLVRMHELPKRSVTIRLCEEFEHIEEARTVLNKAGYQVVAELPWRSDVADLADRKGLVEQGALSKRLWQPAAVIQYFCEKFPLNCEQPGHALDLGCGAGRDATYLALNGWQVTGVDYLPGALEKLRLMAKRNRVSINTFRYDLEKDISPAPFFSAQYNLICVIRYLHRPILQQIKQAIAPGGYIVYQTFMQGCEKFGKPKNPKFILKSDELAKVFCEFKILLDKTEYLEDGRPTKVFIAQKAAS